MSTGTRGVETLATGMRAFTGAVVQRDSRLTAEKGQGRVVKSALAQTIWTWGTGRPQVSTLLVTNWAGLVIHSILNHWYPHMSGKGCFMSRVIHVQSELAAWICVIAVAFTHSLQLPRCLNRAGSLSRFRARYCLCFRVFLCLYVNISAPWICLPYGWVNQDPGPLCYNMQ